MTDFVWEPTTEYIERANVTRLMRKHGIDDYHELVQRSQDDIEWFWQAAIEDVGIDFFQPYTQILDASEGPEWPKWFVGATVNLTYNCVDRHAAGALADSPAIIWEGEEGATRTLTYAEMGAEVNRVANGLRALGVKQGDPVGVYMPMTPEAAIASYSIAKIGAIYMPVFSGFGAPAISTRLNDAGAKVLITADGFWRRGKKVAMKPTADEAVSESPSVEKVVVFRRFPDDECEMGGRDVSWED